MLLAEEVLGIGDCEDEDGEAEGAAEDDGEVIMIKFGKRASPYIGIQAANRPDRFLTSLSSKIVKFGSMLGSSAPPAHQPGLYAVERDQ